MALVTIKDFLRSQNNEIGGVIRNLSPYRNDPSQGAGKLWSTSHFSGVDPSVWAWYDSQTQGLNPQQIQEKIQGLDSQDAIKTEARIASGEINAQGLTPSEVSQNEQGNAEYQQRAALNAGNPAAPQATVNPNDPNQLFNIQNPTTGKQGYQVEGSPIPTGWQAMGSQTQQTPQQSPQGGVENPPIPADYLERLQAQGGQVQTQQTQQTQQPQSQYLEINGAYFQQTQQGLAVVNDPNILQGLKSGQVKSSSGSLGSQAVTGVSAPEMLPASARNATPEQGLQFISQTNPQLASQITQSMGFQGDPAQLDSFLAPKAQSNPVKFVADIFGEIYSNMGLADVKTQFESFNKKIEDLTNEMNDEIIEINDNPWLTEGVRISRVRKIQEKHEGRINSATNSARLMQGFYEDGLQQAQWITGQALGIYNKEVDFQNQLYRDAIDRQQGMEDYLFKLQTEREFSREDALFEMGIEKELLSFKQSITPTGSGTKPPTVKKINGVDMQWNPSEGQWENITTETSQGQTTQQAQSQGNILLLSNLVNDKHIGSAVGPTIFGRLGGRGYSSLTGGRQNFISSVEQVRSQLSLDALISAKSKGATFGALSDTEMRILSASASKLGTWANTDKSGKVTGYSASEKAFTAELDKIRSFATLDYIRSGGIPEDVGAVLMTDGNYYIQNSNGDYTQITSQ